MKPICCFQIVQVLTISEGSGKVGSIRTSGKFGHAFANSVYPDKTAPYEPSHQDFHCLLRLFMFYSNI